jgi:O-methyltransferase
MFIFLGYLTEMNLWIMSHKNKMLIDSPLRLFRDYSLRFELYNKVSKYFGLGDKKISYLEFGVASGSSFKWWLANNSDASSNFFGFDTFEGLPEDWGGFYKKGDMMSAIPEVNDSRASFYKGLFQDTLTEFISKNNSKISDADVRVIHCDADLYTATIFVLSQMYPFLKKGDIILFDEFNVPMHEYKAFKEFTENFYITLNPIGQVNSFYQTAFVVG